MNKLSFQLVNRDAIDEMLFIRSNGDPEADTLVVYELANETGHIFRKGNFRYGDFQLRLVGIPPGAYHIRLVGAGEEMEIIHFIKRQ